MKSNSSVLLGLALLLPLVLPAEPRHLSLAETRELVLLQNLEIQAQKLGMEAAASLYRGERIAMWEPTLVLGVDRVRNERENNTEEFIRQGVEDFEERNTLYKAGIEQPLPTGGALQLNYTLDHLTNNLREQRELEEDLEREYDSFLGVTLVQPLLRNGGLHIGRAVREMAGLESAAALQEYRRQLMQTLSSAEAAYWDLQLAQERVKLRHDSVRVAQKVLEDNRARVEAGKMSEIEVRQAEAGLASRRSQLLEAEQARREAASRLLAFLAQPDEASADLVVSDSPSLPASPEVDADALWSLALETHPDLLSRQARREQESLRVSYAKNQRLPDLNLRASYGYNGLGDSTSDAWDSATDADFPSWVVGVELSIPLGGGARSRGELTASKNRLAQADLALRSIEMAIGQALRVSISRVQNYFEQARNFKEIADMNRQILETELTRLEAGQSDSRKVLDAEEKLTQARDAELGSLTRVAVALVELDLSSGGLLRKLDIDPQSPAGE